MRKLLILFAAACLLTACDKDKEADYIAQYFFGKDSKNQVTPDEPDNGNIYRNTTLAKASDALQKVSNIYMECPSIEDLKTHTDEISKIDNVEEVYFSSISMFVKVKDFMTVSFSFYPELKAPQIEQFDIPQTRQVRTRANTDYQYYPLGFKKAVIIDNQTDDRDWTLYKDALKKVLDKVGIKTDIINSPTIEYMQDGLFDNDIVLIISHGVYDSKAKLHWLITEDIYDSSQYEEINFFQYLLDSLPFVEFHNHYKGFIEDEQIRLDVRKTEDGKKVSKISILLSEKFFSSVQKNFKRKALVFNCACQSLMKGDNTERDKDEHDFAFAKAFVDDRGASVYIGFDEINRMGQTIAMRLLGSIASGQSIMSAVNSLPDSYTHDICEDPKYYSHSWTSDMYFYPENHFDIENSCQVFPDLEEKDENDESIILKMSEPYNMMYFQTDEETNDIVTQVNFFVNNVNAVGYKFIYGFEVSTTRDFAPSLTKEFGVALSSYWQPDQSYFTFSNDGYFHELHFSYPVPKSDLDLATKYYYRAYMDDGTNKYYSDYKDFTTQDRIEQVVPDSIRDRMDPYIPIYEGNNPPPIEGVFVIDPAEIVFDTTNNYSPGDQGFTPIYMRFSNQSTTQNTLDYEERNVASDGRVVSESKGPGAFISGEGDKFSVFFSTSGTTHQEAYDITFRRSLVISGTKTDSGIKDVRYAFVLVEKGSDPKQYIINNGDFRVFKDGDGLAKIASWPSGTRSWGWNYEVKDGKIITPWSTH